MLIVVTGAQGFLGRHVVRRLAADGHALLAVDRRPVVLAQAVPNVHYHVSDLSDPATLIPPECEPVGPFTLIHLAWDLRQRETSYRVQSGQVTALAGLLDAWRGNGLSHVIAPGSAQEFGARGGVINEDTLPEEPLSPYGWAKRATFQMASSWSQQNGVGLLWLRPFIIYGLGQAGSMLVPYAIRQAQEGARAEFSDGLQVRDFVYVDDVVEAIRLGVRKPVSGVVALNLGSRDPVRARDLLRAIADHFRAGDHFIFGARPRRASEPDEQIADCTRAMEVLGWSPKVGWREGIRRVCEEAASP
ncbi:MAG TPA: NAD(P)-dependent oxidoreductase [Kiritimatiellia bacterium]|nr:NAD(P)-dependent oxidoreductase [Kiritimatiellia bacterium]